MIDKEMWEALWQLYPVDMALLCTLTAMISVIFAVCVVAMAVSFIDDDGEGGEVWLD